VMSGFRQAVVAAASSTSRCAITGKGASWWGGIGPAVQAAHIVAQAHWHLYPCAGQTSDAGQTSEEDIPDVRVLRERWERTWDRQNGLLLATHVHQCFDMRLISINPDTRRIRVFVPYDMITEYQDKDAHLPHGVDLQALRHHYDMCCIENMAAKQRIASSSVLSRGADAPVLPAPARTRSSDPTKKSRSQPPRMDTGGNASASPSGRRPSDGQSLEDRLTPPPSDGERSQRGRRWRLGGQRLTDEGYVKRLKHAGWNVIEVDPDNSDIDWSSEEERGRPRKRRCTVE
jgi:hypothetical protein